VSATVAGFLFGVLAGVAVSWTAAWVAAKARILDLQQRQDEEREHWRTLGRWQHESLLRGEGIEVTVVHGIGEAGAVTVDESVIPIRRTVKGDRGA